MLIWKLEFGTCRKSMNHVRVARNARHHIRQRIVTKYLLEVRDVYLYIEEILITVSLITVSFQGLGL